MLYAIMFNSDTDYVEADSFPEAIQRWSTAMFLEQHGDWDRVQEPDSCTLVSEKPVIRDLPGEQDTTIHALREAVKKRGYDRRGHDIEIIPKGQPNEGLAVCRRCGGGEVDLNEPCAVRLERKLSCLRSHCKAVKQRAGEIVDILS